MTYEAANSIIGNLPAQTAEEKLYKYEMLLAVDLYSNGDTWMAIDSATRDTLMRMAQYDSRAGYMAGAVSALVGTGPVTWPIPLIDSAGLDSLIEEVLDTNNWGQKIANGRDVLPIGNTGNASFSIYPNPTFGNFVVSTTSGGRFTLYTILGQKLQEYTLATGKTELYLPKGIQAGIYTGSYKPDDGGEAKVVKIVYQP